MTLPMVNQTHQLTHMLEYQQKRGAVTGPAIEESIPSAHVSLGEDPEHNGRAVSGPVNLQIFGRRRCTSPCYCSCHKQHYLQSPAPVERVLGVLFIGYTASPNIWRGCNEINCSNNLSTSIKITYSFPRWFWQRAISIAVSVSNGPELLLRVPRLRRRFSPWFCSALSGDVESMQRMIADRQASGKILSKFRTLIAQRGSFTHNVISL